MRASVVVLVAVAVASTGCLGGGLYDDGAEGEDPAGEIAEDPSAGVEEGGGDGSWDDGAPPAPGDLPGEVDARFVVDGEPLDNLTLEVVDTQVDRAQGLMFRENLSDDRGMLFVWAGEAERTFWMKNTLIPLDMIFLDRDLRVVDVEHASPDPGDVADDELPRYSSDEPARYVVEVERGYAKETGLSEGDELEILA